MGKKIDQLDVYDDVNTDKSKRDLFEVSKNTGTYASPTYATDGSRKISVEQLKETLNIKEYYIKDVVNINNGDTLELDKLNNIIISSNETFTLPTASISNVGKCIAIRHQGSYVATISGIAGGSIKLININECILLQCVFDGVSTYDWFAISKSLDSKICSNSVTLVSNTYIAKHNDNIEANALSVGSDIDITIPTAGIEGRLIYAYYPTGSPSAFVVELIEGFIATLVQGDYFLIRDNGSYWEAISTSQNVAVTPTLDEVTDEGNTTTNSIEVGGLVVDMPSGLGVAVEITKGGAGEALTVNKTSGSGNVASFNNGTTLVKDLEVSTATANRPTFFDSSKKLVIATGALLGTWFQTLTAKSTPIGADTIIVNDSASSSEAKTTTLTELWTNYLRAFVFSSTLTANRIPKANSSGVLIDSQYIDSYLIGDVSFGSRTAIQGQTVISGSPFEYRHIAVSGGDYFNIRADKSKSTFITDSLYISHESTGTNVILAPRGFQGISSVKFNIFAQTNSVTNSSPLALYHTTAGNSNTFTLVSNASGQLIHTCINDTQGSLIASYRNKSEVVQGAWYNGGLAIGSSTINSSAQLDLQSTSKGFLPNRLTTAQRDAVSWVAGDAGMIIYNSTVNKHQGWNGTTWNDMY